MTFHSVRTMSLAALGVLVCTSVHLAAQTDPLPAISLEELVKIVETSQRKHARVLANYDLKYGTTDRDNPYDSEFVPTENYSIAMEVAIDHSSGKQFFVEREALENALYTFKYFYDGNTTRKLSILRHRLDLSADQNDPRSLEVFGSVHQGQLPYLSAGSAHHQRPGDATFWGIPGRDLANALRSMSNGQVSRATIDGKAVYQVTLRGLVEYRPQDDEEPATGYIERSYRYSLFPDYNMLPVRIEHLRREGEVKIRYDQSDFREIEPGLWYPFSSTRYTVWTTRSPIVIKMKIKEVTVGNEVEIPAELPFPPGTRVRDKVAETQRLVIAVIVSVCGLVLVALFLKSVFSAKRRKELRIYR